MREEKNKMRIDHESAGSLLDTLAQEASCNCLSDLRTQRLFPLLARIIEEIDEDAYPERQWEDADYYITREKSKDGPHAREHLLCCLRSPK